MWSSTSFGRDEVLLKRGGGGGFSAEIWGRGVSPCRQHLRNGKVRYTIFCEMIPLARLISIPNASKFGFSQIEITKMWPLQDKSVKKYTVVQTTSSKKYTFKGGTGRHLPKVSLLWKNAPPHRGFQPSYYIFPNFVQFLRNTQIMQNRNQNKHQYRRQNGGPIENSFQG